MKVFILADDHEPLISGMRPDGVVGCGGQADVGDVDGAWIRIGESPDEARRQVLVKE